jgi:hypothetical protein
MTDPDYRTCAKAGAGALQRWYNPAAGLWQGTGWWNSANALTAVIRYIKLTGDGSHAGVIATTFTAAQRQHAGFVNGFCDDNAWWALAALLHQRVPGDQSYLSWAQREWEWFSSSGLIGPDGLVNDGLTAACQNNGGTTWTYNQGVILGGATRKASPPVPATRSGNWAACSGSPCSARCSPPAAVMPAGPRSSPAWPRGLGRRGSGGRRRGGHVAAAPAAPGGNQPGGRAGARTRSRSLTTGNRARTRRVRAR